jgi:hypothetical protein
MNMDRSYSGISNQGSTANNNAFFLDRLYYRFPVGKTLTAMVGPYARNTEFLAVSPSYYGSEFEGLDYFRLHGAPATYNKWTGAIGGLMWKQPVKKGAPFFAASFSYVAPNANSGNTNYSTSSMGGIGGDNSGASSLLQLGYQAKQWKATFGWNYSQCGVRARSGTQAGIQTPPCTATQIPDYSSRVDTFGTGGYTNSVAFGLAWQPKKDGTFVPSVSLGYGYSAVAYNNFTYNARTQYNTGQAPNPTSATTSLTSNLNIGNVQATQSWAVGLQWKDAFKKGNSAGMGVGQPTFVTATRNGTTPFDGNYAWEWWYKYKVSDNVSVTPMLFYLSNPSGLGAGWNQSTLNNAQNPNVFGGLLTAQFKF